MLCDIIGVRFDCQTLCRPIAPVILKEFLDFSARKISEILGVELHIRSHRPTGSIDKFHILAGHFRGIASIQILHIIRRETGNDFVE